MSKRGYIDIPKRLRWIRNACANLYGVPASVELTKRGVPYVKVGSGLIRVVIFARTKKVRVFFTPKWANKEQLHTDFDLDAHGNVDGWVKNVASFAADTAKDCDETLS